MKKVFLKVFTPLILITLISGCGPNMAVGKWENVQKNPDNTTVITTLSINQVAENYNAIMEAKVEGNESENLQVPVKSIKFSGYIYGTRLTVSEVDNDSSDLSYNSTLTLSDDGKILTMYPGRVKFQRK
jgi:hypothetical protein